MKMRGSGEINVTSNFKVTFILPPPGVVTLNIPPY